MIKYNFDELVNSKSVLEYKKILDVIPGGTQLLSKRPELFAPDIWPGYFSKSKGAHIWDLDNRKFLDMSIMGVGAAILGYANEQVDNEVIKSIKNGVQCSLNSYKEVELSEKLLFHHPWFDMVRYARSGGEAMSIAVRIARATTNKNKNKFNVYHGWCDWYLSANLKNDSCLNQHLIEGLNPLGVCSKCDSTSVGFISNEVDLLESKYNLSEFAAICIEPARGLEISKNVLTKLRYLCDKYSIVLIYDEITSGFREEVGGIHKKFDTKPDIAVFAKSMANGYAMSCVIGKKDVMENVRDSFISSTNWTESVGPTASIETIKILEDPINHIKIKENGIRIKEVWNKVLNIKS